MAAPPPSRIGQPPERSFLQALANKPSPLTSSLPTNPEINPKTTYKGDIACIVTRKDAETLAGHYNNALVGKFIRGKPTMEKLNEAFKSVGFRGKFQLGSIDFRHVLIRFEDRDDYQRMWLKGQWSFLGATMKVLKWTLDFSPETESSIVPVWITIRNVPIYFYNEAMIQIMGNQIGKFIKMDAATLGLTRPSAIKICIEVDLKKKLPGFIRVGIEDEGIEHNVLKLPIEFEDLPSYCLHCQTIGHFDSDCIMLHPELKLKRPIKGVLKPNHPAKVITPVYKVVAKKVNPIAVCNPDPTAVSNPNPAVLGNSDSAVIGKAKSAVDSYTEGEIRPNLVMNQLELGGVGIVTPNGDNSGLTPTEKEEVLLIQQTTNFIGNSQVPVDPTIPITNTKLHEESSPLDPEDRSLLLSADFQTFKPNYCSKDDNWLASRKSAKRSSPDRFSYSLDSYKSNRFTPLLTESSARKDTIVLNVTDDEEDLEIFSEVSADANQEVTESDPPNALVALSGEASVQVDTATVCNPLTSKSSQTVQGTRKNNFFTQLNKLVSPSKHSSPNKIITRSSKSSKKGL